MAIRVSNVRLGLEEPEAALPERLAHALGLPASMLASWRILRKSLDARVKDSMHFVYTAEVVLPDGENDVVTRATRRPSDVRVEMHEEARFAPPPAGIMPLRHRPIVIGSGPAGLVAAY